MTADMVAFVLARAAEREALARACIEEVGPERVGDRYDDDSGVADRDSFPSYPWGVQDRELAYMAGPGHPARVLREVAAVRAVVALHRPAESLAGCSECCAEYATVTHEDEYEPEMYFHRPWPCRSLRLLASMDSDHPDYRAEWVIS